MSNETMTDAALLDWLGRSLHACEGQSRQDSRDLCDHIAARLRGEAAPDGQAGALDAYDAGLLSDFGGGNVEWWQDYIRAELARAHDFYQSQADTQPAAPAPVAGDAVAVDDAMVERGAAGIWGAVPRGVPWPPEREGIADEWREFSRACLIAALAQDRASQEVSNG